MTSFWQCLSTNGGGGVLSVKRGGGTLRKEGEIQLALRREAGEMRFALSKKAGICGLHSVKRGGGEMSLSFRKEEGWGRGWMQGCSSG